MDRLINARESTVGLDGALEIDVSTLEQLNGKDCLELFGGLQS